MGTSSVLEWARRKTLKLFMQDHHQNIIILQIPIMYKYLGEEICKLYKNSYKLNVEIARFYNVYGPGENIDEKYGNVIGIWKSKIKKGEPLPIVGNGEQKRDFVHVDDIVDGLIKIALSQNSHEDAWELGSGINYSINELFNLFKLKFNVDSINIPDQPGNYSKKH